MNNAICLTLAVLLAIVFTAVNLFLPYALGLFSDWALPARRLNAEIAELNVP